MVKICFLAAVLLGGFGPITAASAAEYFTDRWRCGDYTATIDGSDGSLVIERPGAKRLVLPFGGSMSRHHGWGKSSECYPEYAPCAVGGTGADGMDYLTLNLDGAVDGTSCKARD